MKKLTTDKAILRAQLEAIRVAMNDAPKITPKIISKPKEIQKQLKILAKNKVNIISKNGPNILIKGILINHRPDSYFVSGCDIDDDGGARIEFNSKHVKKILISHYVDVVLK